MNDRKKEAAAVKQLGEEIGYGNLMEWASALWRKDLKDKGCPINGALVPKIAELSEDQKLYDMMVKIIYEKEYKK